MQLAFSHSSINTLREILRNNTYFYAREHRKLFVAGFSSELHTDPMQPRKFSTANDLHYTVSFDLLTHTYSVHIVTIIAKLVLIDCSSW